MALSYNAIYPRVKQRIRTVINNPNKELFALKPTLDKLGFQGATLIALSVQIGLEFHINIKASDAKDWEDIGDIADTVSANPNAI